MKKIGNSFGIVWTPDGSHLIKIGATARKGSGKIHVDGDMGHDFLVSLENVILYLQEMDQMDLERTNITLSIPVRVRVIHINYLVAIFAKTAVINTFMFVPMRSCVEHLGRADLQRSEIKKQFLEITRLPLVDQYF